MMCRIIQIIIKAIVNLAIIYKFIIIFIAILMSKSHHKTYNTLTQQSFLKTIHNGFNYFHEIDFASQTNKKKHFNRNTRIYTTFGQHDHSSLQALLNDNKQRFSRIKTQMNTLRDNQLNEYVKKSLRYQEILNINDNKKKRLPTLNTKVGEVVKKSVVQTLTKNTQYTMINTMFRLDGWKPQPREGHTTTIYKNMAVIIGGHCSHPYLSAQVYSFDKQLWIKQFQVPTARSYHSSVFYKSRFVIIFGGMGVYDISRKCRVCYNSINLIDLQSWTCRTLKMSNQQSIEGRRHHGAALMGKYMLVLGGMNTKRDCLKDFLYLDLKQLRWYHKQFKIQGKQLNQNFATGLAKHKIVTNFKSYHKKLPLYSSQYSQSQGLLIFGGFFGNGQQNILLFMGFNTYNPFLKRLEYSGIPPSSIEPIAERMNQNIIIILSGELNDRGIKLYRIKERQFIGIFKHIGPQFYGGIGSTISKVEQDFYIFFGLTDSGYIANMNSFKIQQKMIQNEIKKKKVRLAEFDQKLNWQKLSKKSSQS